MRTEINLSEFRWYKGNETLSITVSFQTGNGQAQKVTVVSEATAGAIDETLSKTLEEVSERFRELSEEYKDQRPDFV